VIHTLLSITASVIDWTLKRQIKLMLTPWFYKLPRGDLLPLSRVI